jgi:hypothetical protein
LTNSDAENPYEFRLQYNATDITLHVIEKVAASTPTLYFPQLP